jgi:hypothetical protein
VVRFVTFRNRPWGLPHRGGPAGRHDVCIRAIATHTPMASSAFSRRALKNHVHALSPFPSTTRGAGTSYAYAPGLARGTLPEKCGPDYEASILISDGWRSSSSSRARPVAGDLHNIHSCTVPKFAFVTVVYGRSYGRTYGTDRLRAIPRIRCQFPKPSARDVRSRLHGGEDAGPRRRTNPKFAR